MQPNPTRVLYWSVTLLFAVAMLLDGVGGILRVKAGQEALLHLGYPMYALTIFGVAKLLGAVALVQSKFQILKEWAYAGFAFTFLGAFASRAFIGDELGLLLPPLVMLGFLFLTYFLWKKVPQPQAAPTTFSLVMPENATSQAA